MGQFDNLFQNKNGEDLTNSGKEQNATHSVIIEFNGGLNSLEELQELETKLNEILTNAGVGYCDGHEVAMDLSDGALFLYGINAETVFKTVKPALENCSFIKGAIATLRFGPSEEGVSEIEVTL